MATKSITIKESAYEILASRKREDESFSDVIERITKRKPLTDLLDLVSEEEGKNIAKEMEKVRNEMDSEIEDRSTQVKEAIE